MKIATYNVDGVTGRLAVLLQWLKEYLPDILCLKEPKAPREKFPESAFRDLGYDAIWHEHEGWNRIAILSRVGECNETRRGLPGDPDHAHSHYIEAAIDGVLIGGLYLPNCTPNAGPKFDSESAWFERLTTHAAQLMDSGLSVILAGDFNVMPTDVDAYTLEQWLDVGLFAPEAKAAYFQLLDQGWTDAVRKKRPGERIYSFWEYFRNAFVRNAGLRIDHLLLSPGVAERLVDARVDRHDHRWKSLGPHAPVWIELADNLKPRENNG